jgi:hypothetical protein
MDRLTELATQPARQTWTRPIVLVPAGALVAALGGLLPSFSARANVYVLLVGGALFWLGLSGRVPRRPSRSAAEGVAMWWLLPLAVLVVAELVNFGLGSTYDHPTLSLLADPVLDHYLPRALGYAAWLAAFWGLVRR